MEIKKTALGLATGILLGASVLLATLWVMVRGGGGHLIILRQFYPGYRLSIAGAVLGLAYGFIDGFVAGWALAWLYNRFAAPNLSA